MGCVDKCAVLHWLLVSLSVCQYDIQYNYTKRFIWKPAALSKHFTSCWLFTDSILRTVFILCPQGFALGATIQSKTKGIWMWCVPHPEKRDHTLVLLDTEGLGDVEKVGGQCSLSVKNLLWLRLFRWQNITLLWVKSHVISINCV